MKGKRILICCNRSLLLGGIEKSLTTFLRAFNTKENDVTLVLFDGKGELQPELPAENLNIIYTSSINPSELLREDIKHCNIAEIVKGIWNRIMLRVDSYWYTRIMYTYRIIKRKLVFPGHFDCAISFTTDYSDLGMIVEANADKRVCFVHGDATKGPRAARMNDPLVRKMDKVYCVSQQAKELFLEMHPACDKAMDVMHNVILHEEIQEKANEPAEGMLLDGTITLCTVGRLSPEKGQQMIPEIAVRLKNVGWKFRWYLVGDGNLRPELEAEIVKRKLESQVILLGSKVNPYPYMKNCDIYVQTSFSEAYCITVAEARNLCKPIVTTNAPGVGEQIINGENGLIVDAMTPEDLFDGIEKLLKYPELQGKYTAELACQFQERDDELQLLYDFIEG